jgi:hypothetical protein
MCGIEWSISADITEDLTDTGQDLIRAAFFNGDSLPFKAYIDATHYYSAEATVSEYGPAVDAEEPNDVSISLTPYKGYVLTSSL